MLGFVTWIQSLITVFIEIDWKEKVWKLNILYSSALVNILKTISIFNKKKVKTLSKLTQVSIEWLTRGALSLTILNWLASHLNLLCGASVKPSLKPILRSTAVENIKFSKFFFSINFNKYNDQTLYWSDPLRCSAG